ncbi:Cupin 2 conserved barrel domain protein [Stanieria cyanosphaera PCC 7437]|uniref:Cupin 2 conserved barrel domain protein n=1 Tax=Stanieria cyanosphaera (strain ATCC 29371 / PCC 7437) TaxID=111780 RepID=K9XXM3_STAC7|nr:cupin domain-containing protein [Stanieria cyanosphaera]AFZ36809.1 Cupin 2 conserved barrel domain protein [Stanieria cyanosphaera PCC 7437]
MANIFQLPSSLPSEELFESLLKNDRVLIERIISTGQTTSPGEYYDQNQDEWVILLQGEAELSYEDNSRIKLVAGDYVFIPAHQKHRVDYTSITPPCIWLAVHCETS